MGRISYEGNFIIGNYSHKIFSGDKSNLSGFHWFRETSAQTYTIEIDSFARHQITFNNKETILVLNRCTIEVIPFNRLDSYIALDNPKFIFIEESDFFRKSEQEDVRHVSEHYIAKSDPFIIMVSTPNAPDGLFEKIERTRKYLFVQEIKIRLHIWSW